MKFKPSADKGVRIELNSEEAALLADTAKGPENLPEFKVKKILVPIDFSECSKKALRYALAFGTQFSASLTLLYIEPFQVAPEYATLYSFEVDPQAKIKCEKDLKDLGDHELGNRVPFNVIANYGNISFEIVDVARKHEVDLIIISTHGRIGFKRFLLGSTTEEVVRKAPCPVLVVREKEHECLETS
jgi:universal stress protein A